MLLITEEHFKKPMFYIQVNEGSEVTNVKGQLNKTRCKNKIAKGNKLEAG